MSDMVYGCDGCRTTLGRAGCATHRDRAAVLTDAPREVGMSEPITLTAEEAAELRDLLAFLATVEDRANSRGVIEISAQLWRDMFVHRTARLRRRLALRLAEAERIG